MNLLEHTTEIVLQMLRTIIPTSGDETGLDHVVSVLGGAGHLGGSIAVGEALKSLLVSSVGTHNIRENESTTGRHAAVDLLEKCLLAGSVAEHFARDDVRELVLPLLRKTIVEVTLNDCLLSVDSKALGFSCVICVLVRCDVVRSHVAAVLLEDLVGDAAMSRPKVQDVRVLGDGVGPVKHLEHTCVGMLGRFINSIGRLAEDSEVDVHSTTTHHILVEGTSMSFVVLLDDLVSDLLLAELLAVIGTCLVGINALGGRVLGTHFDMSICRASR
mmetsp:Transcript_19341/g.23094  ORF Transcript_19341/g.23094 Transcript_19341/m.23094 type:complete len:273 (+) Transcript_19341:735-1553(+)